MLPRWCILRSAFAAFLFGATVYPLHARAQSITIETVNYAGHAELFGAGQQQPQRTSITAQWVMPARTPPRLPAVVLMHGTSGIGRGEDAVAQRLTAAGYAVLIVDRYRGRAGQDVQGNAPWNIVADGFAALGAAAADARIDRNRIGIVGISSGGTAVISTGSERARLRFRLGETRYAAHVAITPQCLVSYGPPGATTGAPMLLILGGEDLSAPPRLCQELVSLHAQLGIPSRIALQVIPGAPHGFLNAGIQRDVFRTDRSDFRNCPVLFIDSQGPALFRDGNLQRVSRPEVQAAMRTCHRPGSTFGFRPQASEAALASTVDFLARYMPEPRQPTPTTPQRR
jgi:dienelactone hydrolase